MGKEKKKIEGWTLVDALNLVVQPPARETDKPLRMPVSGVYKIKGVGDVITGRIEQGQLKPNQICQFAPTGCEGKAFSIEMHHKNAEEANTGDNVGVNVKGLPKEKMPRVGDVMYLKNDPLDKNPPATCASFTAMVFVQDHPGKLRAATADGKGGALKGGFTPSVHVRTSKAPCQLAEIKWKKGKSTGGVKTEGVPFIEAGDSAEVVFHPKMPFCLSSYEECKALGRIAAMDSNSLVMLGKVTTVEWKKE